MDRWKAAKKKKNGGGGRGGVWEGRGEGEG